jgi:hypothetical protein
LDALLLWERSFSLGPVFALHGFLSEVCDTEQLKAARGEIHRSLLRALALEPDALPPDPWPQMQRRAEGSAQGELEAAPFRAEATAVLESLLGGFLTRVEAHDGHAALRVRVYVIEHLAGLAGARDAVQALGRWLGQQGRHLAEGLDEPTMRRVVNLCYVGACEHVGPVAADRALAEAIREAEETPEARSYAPRRLL